MEKEIHGTVQRNPVMLEQCCIFTVEQEDGFYLVVSTDRQAGKDNIFVEQGQKIGIQGSCVEDRTFKGVMITEQAKIEISRNASIEWKEQ